MCRNPTQPPHPNSRAGLFDDSRPAFARIGAEEQELVRDLGARGRGGRREAMPREVEAVPGGCAAAAGHATRRTRQTQQAEAAAAEEAGVPAGAFVEDGGLSLFEAGGELLAGIGLGSLLGGEPSWMAPAAEGRAGAGPSSFAGFLGARF